MPEPRFQIQDKVRLPVDALVGVVIRIGIGLGDNTPERVEVQVAEGDVRCVFAHACELLDAVANDPELPPADDQDDDDAELERLTDPNAN